MRKFIFITLVIILSLTACSPTAAADPSPKVTATDQPPSETPTEAPPTATPTIAPPTPIPELGSTRVSEIDGMVQVYVPAGEFEMGSNDWGEEEQPSHTVYLDDFWIDQTEVTNAMFRKFVDDTGYITESEKKGSSLISSGDVWIRRNGSDWLHPQGPDTDLKGMDDYPVVQMSWNDAVAYCDWAGRALPTEAQWEKAARGTDGRMYPWGDEFNCKNGNFDDETILDEYVSDGIVGCDGYDQTAPVGEYPAGISPYGAYDMAGNVWEWVADWYNLDFYASPSASEDNPLDVVEADFKGERGGSWINGKHGVRTTIRGGGIANLASDTDGFRCIYTVPNKP